MDESKSKLYHHRYFVISIKTRRTSIFGSYYGCKFTTATPASSSIRAELPSTISTSFIKSSNLSMAPAAPYPNTTIGVDSSIWDKIDFTINVPADLIAFASCVVAYIALRRQVVRAAPFADAVTSTPSVDGHESE